MELPIQIEIEGIPVPWKAHAGYGRRSYNPRANEKEFYQFHIKRQYLHNLPLTIGVSLTAVYYLPIPQSISKKIKEKMLSHRVRHIKRPDLDNLNKFLNDCIKGIVIKDDSQICHMITQKIYGEKPRTYIRIEPA